MNDSKRKSKKKYRLVRNKLTPGVENGEQTPTPTPARDKSLNPSASMNASQYSSSKKPPLMKKDT